jgi:cytochrome d ubiquinol oxidase subunit I
VTQANGIWVTFGLILGLYLALGVTLVVTLRAMSRRWRREDDHEDEVPYGPDTEPPPAAVAEGSP